MCQNKFECFLLEMYDKIIHNPKICLDLRGYSVTPIRTRDYLSTPWMVQLTPGVDIDHFENRWFTPTVRLQQVDSTLLEGQRPHS